MVLDVQCLRSEGLLVLAPNVQQNSVALVRNVEMHAVRAERQPGALVFVDWRLEDREESSLGIAGVDAGVLSSLLFWRRYIMYNIHEMQKIE